MSEIIKNVFINYAACAVFGGLLEYITPDNMKKSVRVCVVLLMLAVSFLPLLNLHKDFELDIDNEELQQQEEYNALMHTASLTEKKLYSEMKAILINAGVDEYEIYITTDVDEQSKTVYLEKIKIQVDKAYEGLIPEITNDIHEEYRKILEIGVKNE